MVNGVVTPGRLELPAYGLGNRRSILLSYGVTQKLLPYFDLQCQYPPVVRSAAANLPVGR